MSEITIRREDLNLMTVHDVVDAISKQVDLNDEQLFRITAIVKRYTHYEKHDMYHKFKDWIYNYPVDYLKKNVVDLKIKTHEEMIKMPGEQIVTWSVGTHRYKQ